MDFSGTLRTLYKTSDLISWHQHDALDLTPYFQRRAVWSAGAKSYLIDTMLRGFPIPSLILRDRPTSLDSLSAKREVIDGQQRLRTVIAFVAPHILKNFDTNHDAFTIKKSHNPPLSGKTFNELSNADRQRILDYQFTVHTFAADTDDRDVLEVFARMNATGVKLNDQELRNAEFFGEFKTMAFSLATEQLDRWRKWRIFTDSQIARMSEVQLTSELMILALKGISEGSNRVIDKAYTEYEERFVSSSVVAARIRWIMTTIEQRIDFARMERLRNSTLFYCLFAAIYNASFGLGSVMTKSRKPRTLVPDMLETLHRRGATISTGTAKRNVQNLTERRATHVKERRLITEYLSGH